MRRSTSSEQHDIPISPVLREYGYDVPDVLEGEGWRKTSCVFHPDRNPSASVSYAGYQCFSCDRKFDSLKFLMEEEGIGFSEALSRAQTITGVESRGSRSRRRRSSTILGHTGYF